MRSPRIGGAVSLAVAGAMLISACSGSSSSDSSSSAAPATSAAAEASASSAPAVEAGTVALMIPGTSGDGGFFDQSIQGLNEGASAAGWTAQVVESGYEPTKWGPALDDLAAGDDNLVITGSFNMIDLLKQAAAANPDKDFVMFDAVVDEPNVYSMTYRYDETGFLAGYLAGLLEITPGVERLKQTGVVGVIGGMDIPVINDYIAGFKKGVAAAAPDVKVLEAYAGSFADPVKGKALAEDMIGQGAEILFTAAGATDAGVFEAAAANDVWAIGNSALQAKNATVNDKEAILTSSDTNVTSSIATAVSLAAAGTLPVGTSQSFGVKEGTNSIIESDIYKRVVPAEVQQKITELTADIAAGDYDSVLTAK